MWLLGGIQRKETEKFICLSLFRSAGEGDINLPRRLNCSFKEWRLIPEAFQWWQQLKVVISWTAEWSAGRLQSLPGPQHWGTMKKDTVNGGAAPYPALLWQAAGSHLPIQSGTRADSLWRKLLLKSLGVNWTLSWTLPQPLLWVPSSPGNSNLNVLQLHPS